MVNSSLLSMSETSVFLGPSTSTQQPIKAMQLDCLPPFPSETKVIPVTTVFTSSAASKEERENSDVSEPEMVEPGLHLRHR